MVDYLARDDVNLPRAARISALVNVALADSIYASWKSKIHLLDGPPADHHPAVRV